MCGSKWDTLTSSRNAFDYLGSSTARYGCCPANNYMSSPEVHPFLIANSCSSSCPAGQHISSPSTSIENDETSCESCASGKCSAAGSTTCSTCDKLPNGNGKQDTTERLLSFGGVIDDLLGDDSAKKLAVLIKYGPIQDWDTSEVLDMRYAFVDKSTFNADLSKWVVAQIVTMDHSTSINTNLFDFIFH